MSSMQVVAGTMYQVLSGRHEVLACTRRISMTIGSGSRCSDDCNTELCTYACMFVCMYVCVYVCGCVHACMYVCVCV